MHYLEGIDRVSGIKMKNLNVLYLLNCFPALSEVFVLNEITGFIDLGWNIRIVSISTPNDKKVHNSVVQYNLFDRTTYLEYTAYSRRQLFQKGVIAFLSDSTLGIRKKLQLLHLCHNNDAGGLGIKWFLNCLKIIAIIKQDNIDHIHCHFASNNVRLAYIVHQIIRIPYTFTAHSYEIFPQSDKDIEVLAANAKKVIAPSEFNKQYMYETLRIPSEHIQVVTCSKYLDKLQPVKNYTTSPFRIVSVSRLVEKKGYPYLIEACKILKERGVEFSCTIHGEGKQREELQHLIQESCLEKDITLGGALTHEEVLAFISTGSVFVLPCIRASNNDLDVIPNVLMESMAMGIPTISTHISGIPELIENSVNGLLVPPNDSHALAEAIIKIKEQPDFTETIRLKGRENVENKFNVKKNVMTLAKIFTR